MAWADRKISEYASKRIATMAYEIALKRYHRRLAQNASTSSSHPPPRVTVVHKSNVLSVTDGLFRESCHAAKAADSRFDLVKVDEQLVDSMVYV